MLYVFIVHSYSGQLRQPQVPESIARGEKPLGYRTYYLCKTAFLLFLLHMYVFLKY